MIMDDQTKMRLCGSPARDVWKLNHKIYCPKTAYGADLDFVVLSRDRGGLALFAIAFENGRPALTFANCVLYNSLTLAGISVALVCGDAEKGQFDIYWWVGGNPHPRPNGSGNIRKACRVENWDEYQRWEMQEREAREMPYKTTHPGLKVIE